MDLYHINLTIRDDMTSTEVVDALRDMVKALSRIAGASLIKGKHTPASQSVQQLFAATATLENCANSWGGPSPLAVPQMVMGQRPS